MNVGRTGDPLYRDEPLGHEWSAPVLGVPVRIRSNVLAVTSLAEDSFGAWHALGARQDLVEPRTVDVRIVVQEGSGAEPVAYRRPDATTLVLFGAGGAGYADAVAGRALAYVSRAALADVEQFRYSLLEALVLFLVTGRDRYPVHASAIARNGLAVVLAGRSAVGKSTMAYAAGAAGWAVFSDDVVYVQGAPVWRVWGGGGSRSCLPRDAVRFFPELGTLEPRVHSGGELKFAVPRTVASPLVCERAVLCVLQRGDAPALERMPADAAVEALTQDLEPGFDVLRELARERLAPLAHRAFRLTLVEDPRLALPLLERLEGADA